VKMSDERINKCGKSRKDGMERSDERGRRT
jgi:hypothetical protein